MGADTAQRCVRTRSNRDKPTHILRGIRKSDLMDPYPRIKAYYARARARPAWQRTLALCSERVGVRVDDIR